MTKEFQYFSYLNIDSSVVTVCTKAPFTLVRFHFKTHNFFVYANPAFSRLKPETFENDADPVLV